LKPLITLGIQSGKTQWRFVGNSRYESAASLPSAINTSAPNTSATKWRDHE